MEKEKPASEGETGSVLSFGVNPDECTHLISVFGLL
jgi:hypothetical protein